MELARPQPRGRILDIGCGTGTMAIRFKQKYPDCEVVAIDPDLQTLDIAKRKAKRKKVQIRWLHGFVDHESVKTLGQFSLIVTSLVLHQTSNSDKREILGAARRMLLPFGQLFIADYGIQSTWLMKTMYRLVVQTIDGKQNTQPNAEGFISRCLEEVGFDEVNLKAEYPTITGSISLLVAGSSRN